ncbi:MAG: ATP-binding protein [Ignavibacteria bacterium]|nr:MAG: ATP-binding protein [Ignavibacteria bacterium]
MSKKKINREITVKSTTENLSVIRDFINDQAARAGFDADDIHKIILAVDEACTNVIKHAYKFSPEGEITISTKIEKNKFVISIFDRGLHFDPNKIPEPDIIEYHKSKKIGGLGMYLMKKLMDEVRYNISTDSNQVILIKNLKV